MRKMVLFYLIMFFLFVMQVSVFYFYEIGIEDVVFVGVGQVVCVQDVFIIVINLVGMMWFFDYMFIGGLQVMDGDIFYDLDNVFGYKSFGNVMNLFFNVSVFYL